MPSTISPSPAIAAPPRRAPQGRAAGSASVGSSQRSAAARGRAALARYVDERSRPREVLALAGMRGSVLVVDHDAATLGDRRLVAHLAADEPRENAALVVASYLDRVRLGACRCRRLTAADLRCSPFLDDDVSSTAVPIEALAEPLDRLGRAYRLQPVRTGMSVPDLRWRRLSPPPGREARTVSTREAIAALESYEPIRALTLRALTAVRREHRCSTAVLRAELARVQQSPIVLNRRLREAILARTEREGLSMSEIAIRCGRVKRAADGHESGETSWLARRVGLLPEGGKDAPTPWIHTDVLALIARRGLGISPREVEVP